MPVATSDVAEIEDAIVGLVRAATRPALQGNLARRAGVSLDRAAYNLLRVLDDEGPLRLRELSERLGVDDSTTSRQVKHLVEAGMLARSADPEDGRARQLRLTAAGRRAVQRLQAARHAVFEEVLNAWSAADRSALAPLLARLARDLQQNVGGKP